MIIHETKVQLYFRNEITFTSDQVVLFWSKIQYTVKEFFTFITQFNRSLEEIIPKISELKPTVMIENVQVIPIKENPIW